MNSTRLIGTFPFHPKSSSAIKLLCLYQWTTFYLWFLTCESDFDMMKCESDFDMIKCESDFDMMKCESDFDLMKCESVFDLMTCESVFWLEETWISLWRDEKWIRFWPDEIRFSFRHKGLSEAACLYHFVLSCSAPQLWNRSADSNMMYVNHLPPSTQQKNKFSDSMFFNQFSDFIEHSDRLPGKTLLMGDFNFQFEKVENNFRKRYHRHV